ncbi:MAG TPA: multidrug transporter [Pseudomonadales bacterium]|nr:multidrug transporter [Pseudomonadales bacterium]
MSDHDQRTFLGGLRRAALPMLKVAGLVVGLAVLPGAQAAERAAVTRAEKPSGGAMVADLLVARPLGLAFTAVGSAAWLVSLPFSALGGNVNDSAEQLVIIPAAETFARCLGCRNSNYRQSVD